MAKEFTHLQSIQAVTDAIKAVADGKSQEECNAMASTTVNTVLNSNSITIAEQTDEAIASQIQETLQTISDETEVEADGDEVLPPPEEAEGDDGIPF